MDINSLFLLPRRVARTSRGAALLLPVLLVAWGCLPGAVRGPSGAIEGKALFGRQRVAGARVRAVSDLGVSGAERTFAALADGQGEFRLALPPGSYYLSFTGPDGIYGFFGGNPVNVLAGKPSQVALRGLRSPPGPSRGPSPSTVLEGVALMDGRPVPGASVQVFLDASSHFRGPGYAMVQTDASGRFSLDVPPGRYYVLARLRRGSGRTGPLGIGDRYAWYPGNPVYLGPRERAVIELPFLEVEKDPSRALQEASGASLVTGRVLDREGRPVAGAYACLYPGPEPMGMPAYVSEATDGEGRFTLRVTVPGDYWLAARRSIGRPLETNERVSFYRGPSGSRVTVEATADIAGMVIIWEGE